jgi:predicted HD superfamily hydrolase involved in NAD metabolism
MCAKATTDTPHAERAARRLERRSPFRNRFSRARWRHTLSVAETAHRLASALGWAARDRDRVIAAALLHDVAKELPLQELRRLAGEDGRHEAPSLLHAWAGARLARDEFGISDDRILRAIAIHPTAAANASRFSQLLFVSDFLEPHRKHLDDEDRSLLQKALRGRLELSTLFCRVLRKKLGHFLANERPLHPRSLEAWNWHCAGGA